LGGIPALSDPHGPTLEHILLHLMDVMVSLTIRLVDCLTNSGAWLVTVPDEFIVADFTGCKCHGLVLDVAVLITG